MWVISLLFFFFLNAILLSNPERSCRGDLQLYLDTEPAFTEHVLLHTVARNSCEQFGLAAFLTQAFPPLCREPEVGGSSFPALFFFFFLRGAVQHLSASLCLNIRRR